MTCNRILDGGDISEHFLGGEVFHAVFVSPGFCDLEMFGWNFFLGDYSYLIFNQRPEGWDWKKFENTKHMGFCHGKQMLKGLLEVMFDFLLSDSVPLNVIVNINNPTVFLWFWNLFPKTLKKKVWKILWKTFPLVFSEVKMLMIFEPFSKLLKILSM